MGHAARAMAAPSAAREAAHDTVAPDNSFDSLTRRMEAGTEADEGFLARGWQRPDGPF